MPPSKKYKLVKYILPISMIAVSFLSLLYPISDPDFFWNLKTGEWIWNNRSLPPADPFAYTTPQDQSIRAHFILSSYWLSQVIYHLLYLATGVKGILLLRFVLFGLFIIVMTKLKEGDDIVYTALLLIFLVLMLGQYDIERPQFFSFLFFAILLFSLREIRNFEKVRGKGIYLRLSLLMLLWSNMHGGYLVGQIVIVLSILSEGLKFAHRSLMPIKKEAFKKLFIAGTIGLAFSLINPNTYHALTVMTSLPEKMTSYILEYRSTFSTFRLYHDYTILLYWFILFLSAGGVIINFKKLDITEAVLLAGTGFFSFTNTRYIAFFAIAALPICGRYLGRDRLLNMARLCIPAVAILSCVLFSWSHRANLKNITTGKWVDSGRLPVDAAEFVIANELKGNMYNTLTLGGYLIWRLAPARKVFIDGRYLNEDIYMTSRLIAAAYPGEIEGMPAWKFYLNKYDVQYIIIPYLQRNGQVLPLFVKLLGDRDWVPVFFRENTLIFVKNSPENRHVPTKALAW